MSDIVERLRRKVFKNPQVGAPHERTVEWQAADEIERLRKENQELKLQYLSDQGQWIEETGRLREALRDIAEDQEGDYDFIVWQARAALGEKE